MATTKVISTTWNKKTLATKLKQTLKRMDDEIVAWNKANATIRKRQDAWDKKAEAWAKKNISKASDIDFSSGGYKGPYISLFFDKEALDAALGERPEMDRKPSYKDTSYDKKDSDYDQVANAIALVENCDDDVIKITSSSTWASFIR